MAKKIAIMLLALVATGCAGDLVVPDDGALAVIPRETVASGHIAVEVRLDGRGPFRFVLDTGASISAVFEHTRAAAGITAVPAETVRVLGTAGSGTFPVANIASIEVGSETWNSGRVAVLPDTNLLSNQVDGILGLDFLGRYAVWYSQHQRAVLLYPRNIVAERSYHGWTSIPLYEMQVGDADAKALAFDIYIDLQRIPTMFDLGSSVNLMNRRAARALDVPVRKPRDLPDVWGVTGKTVVLVELIVSRLQIETMYWRRRTFLIGDFPVFDALGIGNRPVAIAGIGFFRDRDFIIDLERNRLLVKSRSRASTGN